MFVSRRVSLQLIILVSISLLVACAAPVRDTRAPVPVEPARQQVKPVTPPVPEPAPGNTTVGRKTDAAERQPGPKSTPSPEPAKPSAVQPDDVKRLPRVETTRPSTPATTASPSPSGQTAPVLPAVALSEVDGKIRLLGKNGEIMDSSGVIINLQPVINIPLEKKAAQEHFINMVDKTYMPGVLTMRTDDTLSFINGDTIKHNVFSSSGNNSFDLGTYGTGKTRSIRLGNSGVVKVYCNIHPEMATFVNVSEHDIAAVTDSNGDFKISSVPVGQYKVRVWHVRGELERDLTVKAGTPAKLELIMDTSSYQGAPHKNKFGRDYKKKPALFEDEFY